MYADIDKLMKLISKYTVIFFYLITCISYHSGGGAAGLDIIFFL